MTVRSLFVGLSGLTAMGQNIDVIGNNIANVNTVGFRSSRASFDDIFYQTLYSGTGATATRGGINPREIGTGVKLGSVDKIFTQGSTQSTGRLLDLAINGDGFFVLRDGAGDEKSTEYLSRAGDFSLDDQGFIVDPGTGYHLIGQTADSNGDLETTKAPGALQIDSNRKSLAQATTKVSASGNFDASVGDGTDVSAALSTSNLLGLFDENGEPMGLVNGDVIRFDSGYLQLNDPPIGTDNPVNLTQYDANGKGEGVILTITSTTTVADLQDALTNFFSGTVNTISPGTASGIDVNYNTDGAFEFSNSSKNALKGIQIGLSTREGEADPPKDSTRLIGNLFVNEGDPDFTKTLNVGAGQVVTTNQARQADRNTSIDIYDSLGASHSITVGLAADTHQPAAIKETTVDQLRDDQGRFLIPDGIVPPKVEILDAQNDTATNTATFTARQVSNIVATQGVYSYADTNGNLIALRLTDGAISINGGAFNAPTNAALSAVFTANEIDVTGSQYLNVPSSTNQGGLLGSDGFTASTTLETIRENLEERINSSIQKIASNLVNLDPATLPPEFIMPNVSSALAEPATKPEIKVILSDDGSFTFASSGGSLGASQLPDTDVRTQNLIAAAGGADNMGLSLDLAAKTRSIRISTLDSTTTPPTADQEIDIDNTDAANQVTGFIKNATAEEIFGADLSKAFTIGNTDTGPLTAGDPTLNPPTGVNDSGVQLVAMSSGTLYQSGTTAAPEYFSEYNAFEPETTAFQALFNQRGYGIASNFDGTAGVDRAAGVPVGIVAREGINNAFETNTIHQNGQTQNTVNFQAVVPNDARQAPQGTTGSLYFDSSGRFDSYGSGSEPNIAFDYDYNDPQNGGARELKFNLDLSGITQFDSNHTAQLQSQNGRPIGQLDSVSIASNGEIMGLFTNGDSQTLGKILLATVTNEDGLVQKGNTLFMARDGDNSGDRIFVEADLEGGSIESGSLELSNVDLAQEFTNMIVAQRAYQANTRVITTADAILQEVVNLKR